MESRPFRGGAYTGGVDAPSPRFKSVPILDVHGSSWYDLVILTSSVYGVFVYWDGGRCQPITDEQNADDKVYRALLGKRWQGWLAVRPYRSGSIHLVAVTPVTVACVPQLRDQSIDLRGWTIGLRREGPSPRAKLKGRWNNVRADLDTLHHPPCVPHILEKMWRAPLKEQSTPCPSGTSGGARDVRKLLRESADSLDIPT